MRTGSIFGIVALGTGVALTPGILDIDVSGDATGQAVLDVLTPAATFVSVAFVVAVFGLFLTFYTDSGF